MAMKFWFSKKGTEQGECGRESLDTPVMSDSADGSVSAAAGSLPLFGVTQQADAGKPAGVPLSGEGTPSQSVGAGGQGGPKPLSMGAGPNEEAIEALRVKEKEPAPTGSGPQVKRPAVTKEGGGLDEKAQAAAVVLKVVGGSGPMRLGVSPSGETAPAQQKVEDGVKTGVRPVFGLRARSDAASVSEAAPPPSPLGTTNQATVPAPASKPETSEGDRADDLVRPKTDQRALYYQLMNGLYDAILILDEQGHVVDSSKRVSELLGYTREDTWDLPIEKVITGMSRQMLEHLRRNLAENHHVLIDARCFRQDGTSFAGEVGVSTLTLTRGTNMVFAIRNVERRKNMLDELRRSHAALEVALVPVFVCDADGFFQVVNQALLDVFGIPDAEQAKSVRVVDLLPDVARHFLRAACGQKVREKIDVSVAEGQLVKLDVSLVPVQNGTNITGVAGSIQQL